MSTTTTRMPGPVYAVAGAGELAFQQLLKLPAVTAELADELRRADLPARVEKFRADLPGRVEKLRADLPGRVEKVRADLPARVEQLRAELPAAMTTFVSEAYQVYNDLVARGEAVVEARRNGKIVVKASTGTPSRDPATARKTTKATKPTKATKTAKTTKAAPKATKSTGSTAAKRTRPASPK